jgi:hypothetical protein
LNIGTGLETNARTGPGNRARRWPHTASPTAAPAPGPGMGHRLRPQTWKKSYKQPHTRPGETVNTFANKTRQNATPGGQLIRTHLKAARGALVQPGEEGGLRKHTMRRAGAGDRGRWRAQGPRRVRRPLRPGAAQRAARQEHLSSLQLASTVSSRAGRVLGAPGDERCFDEAEPRLGPPNNDHGPGRSGHFHATPHTSGGPLDTRGEPRWAHATRHGRCHHEKRPSPKTKIDHITILRSPPLAFVLKRLGSPAPALAQSRMNLGGSRNTRCWDAKCSSVALAACTASPLAL